VSGDRARRQKVIEIAGDSVYGPYASARNQAACTVPSEATCRDQGDSIALDGEGRQDRPPPDSEVLSVASVYGPSEAAEI